MQQDSKTALIFCGIAVGLLVFLFILRGRNASMVPDGSALRYENGVQIVDLAAQGGYVPSSLEAQAGVPTELRVATNGTYDCSSALVIPSLGYQRMLQPTGIETIALTAEQAQGTLEGMCSMGMYRFEITFK